MIFCNICSYSILSMLIWFLEFRSYECCHSFSSIFSFILNLFINNRTYLFRAISNFLRLFIYKGRKKADKIALNHPLTWIKLPIYERFILLVISKSFYNFSLCKNMILNNIKNLVKSFEMKWYEPRSINLISHRNLIYVDLCSRIKW